MPTTGVPSKDAIVAQFKLLGWAVDEAVPSYHFTDVVKRFQRANLSATGQPLSVDGQLGPMTMAALFGPNKLPQIITLQNRLLAVAASQVGIAEVPPGSNSGPQVRLILRSVGLDAGYPWCASFIYWLFRESCRQLGRKNPCPKNAGVLNMWSLAGFEETPYTRITAAEARANPLLVKPGMQFFLKFSSSTGHTGLVEDCNAAGHYTSYEGNSSVNGEREGTLVAHQTKRTVSDKSLLGFVGYPQ